MATCVIGTLLLGAVIVGGIYLYYKVELLDREIARQQSATTFESTDGDY